jgi:DNA-binding CsgD family transcriptional regulator
MAREGKSTLREIMRELDIEENTAKTTLMHTRKILKMKGVEIDLISRYSLRVVRVKSE